MSPRAVGIISVALVLCMDATFAHADGRHGAMLVFPSWHVSLSEEPWANEALDDKPKSYPITNLFDGEMATAWVFEGPKWDGKGGDSWDRPLTGTPFLGGVAQWIEIRSLSGDPPLIDAIGIVNGYAKSPAVYARNNRITRIQLDAAGSPWEPKWSQAFDLEPVMWMQIIHVPEMPAERLRITVQQVEPGPDNDLCISEIQLYHKGRAVIPRPRPLVLCSPGDACGCFCSLFLADTKCQPAHLAGIPARYWIFDYWFAPGGRLVALFGDAAGTGDEHTTTFMIADLEKARVLFTDTTLEWVTEVAWSSDSELRITAQKPDGADLTYTLDLSSRPARLTPRR